MHGWYYYGDDPSGGDFDGTWHMETRGQPRLVVINEQRCVAESDTRGQVLRLSSCSYAGEWARDPERERYGHWCGLEHCMPY
jgi:hypothetical protein